MINISDTAAIDTARIGKLSEPSKYGLIKLIENATSAIENELIPSGVADGGIRSNKPPAAKPSKAALAGDRLIAKLITSTNASGGTTPGREIIVNQVASTIPLRKSSDAMTAILIPLMKRSPMGLVRLDSP